LEYKLNIFNKEGKMKNKIYQKVLKRVFMFVAPLVFLFPVMLFAQTVEYEIELENYNLNVWDVSGSYSEYQDGITLNFTLIQDSKGKLTGHGSVSSNSYSVYMDYELKGTAKASNGILMMKYTMKGSGTSSGYEVKTKQSVSQELNVNSRTMVGTAKVKGCAKGLGCASDTISFSTSLPYDMTGWAVLEIEVEPDMNGKKLEGTGYLILSNDEEYPLSVKGKHNSKQNETKFALKGSTEASKNIKVKLKINEGNGDSTFISGKALGQKLKYKQE
jgi:hypothetical protein